MSNGYKRYLVSYRHDGGEWNVELQARSLEDARRRLDQLVFGRLEGEIIAKIPAPLGPLAALTASVRNFFQQTGSAV
jgi:hypothetical protein